MRKAVVLALLAMVHDASAAPPPKKPVRGPAPPPAVVLGPMPMLPTIAEVRVVVAKSQVLVTEDVRLPVDAWHGEALDLHVAFGAPGVPRAIDAHLLSLPKDAATADEAAIGHAVAFDRAPRRPRNAHGLLGRETMAGIVVHLRPTELAAEMALSSVAVLRLRSALDMPEDDPRGGKSLLVRLGASQGMPLTLERVAVAGEFTRATAHLCGPDADARPLAVSGAKDEAASAPVLTVRHATDDLCLRFWLR